MWAARAGHEEVASLLLERGAAVNAVDTNQSTALHYAGHNDSGGVVRILLAQPGVDCNPRDSGGQSAGQTPVMAAVVNGKTECVRVLAGDPRVKLDTRDDQGRTLEAAAW
jgi:ankyrin repeat protein